MTHGSRIGNTTARQGLPREYKASDFTFTRTVDGKKVLITAPCGEQVVFSAAEAFLFIHKLSEVVKTIPK